MKRIMQDTATQQKPDQSNPLGQAGQAPTRYKAQTEYQDEYTVSTLNGDEMKKNKSNEKQEPKAPKRKSIKSTYFDIFKKKSKV